MQRNTILAVLSVFIFCQPALALTQADVPSIYKNIAIENSQPVVHGPEGKLFLDPGQAAPDYTLRELNKEDMMNTLKLTVIILAMSLAFAGCSLWRSRTPAGKSTVEDDLRLSTGSATLAERFSAFRPAS